MCVCLASASASGNPEPEPSDEWYVDREGSTRNPAEEYAARLDAMDPSPVRALLEEVLLLSAGVIWYWADEERNLADWDYPSWKQRFTLDAWRYDNNEFPINFIAHPLNGAAFYAFPRANDHGPYVSLLYSFTTSFVWEFLLEFREKVSINDVIVTPLAGMTIGEFAAKLWRYVNALPEDASTGHRVAAAVVGFPSWLHAVMDESPPVEGPLDALGFSAAMSHRFEVGYALRVHRYDRTASTHGVRIAGRLSTIPGEGRPGRFGLFFHDADVSTVAIEAGLGAGAREVVVDSETMLFGYYDQSVDDDGDGHRWLVGMPLAYHYRFMDFPGFNDRLGLMHLPGLGADAAVVLEPLTLTGHARLHADFAGIHSAAYGPWVAATLLPTDRPKSILRKHNYYYGWGIYSDVGVGLRLGPFDAGLSLAIGSYGSHDGLDRTQEELTRDPSGADQMFEVEMSLGVTVPDTPLRLAIGATSSKRRSRIDSVSVERDRVSGSLSLTAVF